MARNLKIRDLTLRDGQQSSFATRMNQEQIDRCLPFYKDANFYAMEVWGGAVPDSVMRYLDENPWTRLETIHKAVGDVSKLTALSRGRNLFGYSPYTDEIIDGFCRNSIQSGLGIMRIFDALNDVDNVKATIQRTVDDTKVKFEQGVASEYDYLTAQVELSNLLPTITQTKNSIRVAMLQLKMYLSVPEALSIELVGNLDEMKDVVLAGGETLSTDVSRNSDLRALDIQAEMLRYQLKTTNAARIPTVAAFGSATITGNDMEDFRKMVSGGAEAGTGEAVADLNSSKYFWTHPISVGVQISIPIFSGLKNSYKSRQVKNQIEQLDLQRDYAQRQTTVAVESAINNLLTAREMMLAQARTMAQADKAYHISDTRFRAGAGTILELNSAQLNRTQAHLNYSQAIYDYLSAQADYDRIVGREVGGN